MRFVCSRPATFLLARAGRKAHTRLCSSRMVLTRAASSPWKENIVEKTEAIHQIALEAKRIAVLGIKTEAKPEQPAFHVPEYLLSVGKEIIPVPVYYPEVTKILGIPVFRKIADIPGGPVDIVNVFRRPQDVPGHLEDLIKAKPRCVWLQLGIRNDEAAEALAKEGIKVVQDKCILIEHMDAVEAQKAVREEGGGGRRQKPSL